MNTRITIAAGVIAGLVAGVTLVGTAVAAPRMMTTPAFNGYGMMQAIGRSGTYGRPTIAQMNSFMSSYVTADGSIDVNRMHADASSGKATPPCLGGAAGANSGSKSQGGSTSYRRGPAMMQSLLSNNGGSNGYTMMGSIY